MNDEPTDDEQRLADTLAEVLAALEDANEIRVIDGFDPPYVETAARAREVLDRWRSELPERR